MDASLPLAPLPSRPPTCPAPRRVRMLNSPYTTGFAQELADANMNSVFWMRESRLRAEAESVQNLREAEQRFELEHEQCLLDAGVQNLS